MGQTIGRAQLPPDFITFLNLPKSCVYELWEAFNDVAEGFGLTVSEFQEILRVAIKDNSGLTEERLDALSDQLFKAFDTDQNDLVDALEFLSSLAVLSGMDIEEKIRFIFGVYDFDESGLLTVDETVLAMRATVGGLCKLASINYPLEQEIENIATSAFPERRPDVAGGEVFINKDDFVMYCKRTAEVVSWLEFFGDNEDLNSQTLPLAGVLSKKIITREEKPEDRDAFDLAAVDPDDGGLDRLAIERRGNKLDVALQDVWRSATSFTEPPGVEPDESPPNAFVKLERVHGHNAGYRQNIYYGKGRSIVYPAGAVGVVLDLESKAQRFYVQHTDKISALRTFTKPSTGGVLVATGQLGHSARIHVWDATTLETLSTLRGFHRQGVQHVDFNSNGTLIASVGMDPQHCVAVWEWSSRTLLFTSPASTSSVHGLQFLSSDVFVTCGLNHVHFWTIDGKQLRRTRGIFGKKVLKQAVLCVACLNGLVVSGTISGNFLVWEGRNCVKTIKAHSGAITCLQSVSSDSSSGFISATDDGKVSIWNQNLELGHSFDTKALGPVETAVQAVCWNPANQMVVLGTLSGEIFEISDFDGSNVHKGPVALGHFDSGVWGVAVHPVNPCLAVTVGDDHTVRMWDVATNTLVKMVYLDTPARSCCFSPDGSVLAVGLGLDAPEGGLRKDGAYVVLDAVSLTVVHEARDSKRAISDLKFSPDGSVLALASHDCTVYFYNVADFGCKAKCRGHKGKVTHIDFSVDGLYLQSTCDAGQILFWDVELCEERAPRSMKTVQWLSQSCVYSWSLRGAWGVHDDHTQLTACTRTKSGSVYATSDWFGRLRLWRNPVVGKDPAFIEAWGHAPRMSKVEFTIDDRKLLSIGKGDNCLFQWSVELESAAEAKEEGLLEQGQREQKVEELDGATDMRDGDKLDAPSQQEAVNEGDMSSLFAMEERGGEEDFAPMQPWQRIIVAPSKPPEEDNAEPSSDVTLEWVYGYRCYDTRGSVLYTKPTRDVVFFTGCTVVVMRPRYRDSHQKFYLEHSDEVLAIATHPFKPVVASGQRGRVPRVHVWNPDSLETLCILKGFHRRAVTLLRFSRNGKLLATIGHDMHHSVAVYDWENQVLVSQARTTLAKPLALDFTLDNSGLVICGQHFINFWSMQGRNLTCRNAVLDSSSRKHYSMKQAFTTIGWAGNSCVIGTASGQLWRFNGVKTEGAIKAHQGPIYTMSTTNEGLVTGGKDGYVRMWDLKLQVKLSVELKSRGSLNPVVRSVCWDNEQFRLLVGTLGNEIYELNANDGNNVHANEPLLQCHFASELHGLVAHPTAPEFITVGDDRLLRIWNIRDRKVKRMHALENPSRAVAYNPDADLIAVGFGSPLEVAQPGQKRLYDGKWIIMQERNFNIIHEARDSTKWITEIKWSPNGTLLAVGSFDNKIYVYAADSHFSLSTVVTQHNSWIRHIDFSANSVHMQANCGAYELCFYEADTGLFIPAASKLKDVVWNSQTCTNAWSVQGVWPAQNDGTEVTSVDVNFATEHGEKVAAAGDSFGRLRLFKYPVQSSYATPRAYQAQTAISKVRWVGGDSHLISMGARDRTIFQWRHEVDDLAIADAASKGGAAAVMKVEGEDGDAKVFDVEELVKQLSALEASLHPPEDAVVAKNRPWLASIVEPTRSPAPNTKRPEVEVELAWVHGYSSQMTRNSLAYNLNREAIYPAAHMCVIYDRRRHSQRFYRSHEREVIAIAVAPNTRIMASAERARRPRIRVWDAQTTTELAHLPPFHRVGVGYMSFSANSRRLVSVGQDMDHSVAVWASSTGDWNDAILFAHAKGDVSVVYFADFAPRTDELHTIVTGGHEHIKFWELQGRNLRPRPGVCSNVGVMQTMLCGAAMGNRFASGGVSGHMYVWRGRALEKVIRAHDLSVTAMHATHVGLATGGKDGYVKLWGPGFEHLRTYDLSESPVPPILKGIRAVHLGLDSSHQHVISLLVGTESSEVYEVARDTGSTLLLTEGHFHDELWGLAPCPTNPDVVATAGDDSTIRLWSLSQRRLLRKALLDCPARALGWSPDGKVLVAGLGGSSLGTRQKKDGAFVVLNAGSLQVLFEGRDSRHWIREVKFAPNGEMFALASTDNKIYLYNAATYVLRCKCDKHSGPLKAVDFSQDSTMLQSDGLDYEHNYFSAVDGSHIRLASQVKDVQWASWTTTTGWPVQGIWPPMDHPEVDPSACQRSHGGGLVAAVTDAGLLKVYNYPAVAKTAEHHLIRAHPYSAANVRFTAGDEYLTTVGKKDRAFAIWRVRPSNRPPPATE